MDYQTAAQHIWTRSGVLIALMFIALCGCESNGPDNESPNARDAQLSNIPEPPIANDADAQVPSAPFYSGAFAVTNASDRTIVIQDWENFEGLHPTKSDLPPGFQILGTDVLEMDRFPESTVVSWVFQDDSDAAVHSQTIDLVGVVPANSEGRTEFIFGADGQWTVRFLPERDEPFFPQGYTPPDAEESNDPYPFYSGDFAVTNESDRTIIIEKATRWANFGFAQPSSGFIVPGVRVAESHFPKLDRFPESTAVSWVVAEGDPLEDEQNGPVHSQTIDLHGVVPENTEGYTEFIYSADGEWTVRFVPEPD